MNYDDMKIAGQYDAARYIPEETMSLWLDTIANHIPADEINMVLDVGCGTGRFSVQVAKKFKANVIGIDPSTTMLVKANKNVKNELVSFCNGDAGHLAVADETADLLYLSMVYHHIGDVNEAVREFRRVLREGGFVCIRNSTVDLLEKVVYLKYFPTAIEFNRKRLPLKRNLITNMQDNGFELLSHEVVQQHFADSLREYCDKISQRGLSDLAVLSDNEFEAGAIRMNKAVERDEIIGPILEPIDLFVFKKMV